MQPYDRTIVRVQVLSSGTDTLQLGAAVPGCLDLSGVQQGSSVKYELVDIWQDGTVQRERGQGTVNVSTTPHTLTRAIETSTTGGLINIQGIAEVSLLFDDIDGGWF